MRRIKLCFFVLFFIFTLGLMGQNVGEPAPDFAFFDVLGDEYILSDYNGQVVLLFALGNSCSSCMSAGPYVEALYQEFVNTGQVAALGLDFWDPTSSVTTVNAFIVRTGISFPILLSAGSLSAEYAVNYDRLLVIAQDGTLAFKGSQLAFQDIDGARQVIQSLLAPTSVSDKIAVTPDSYELYQNIPNPFNPSTRIHYSLADEGLVNLTVYDLLGREIQTLVNAVQPKGNHSVLFQAENIPHGVYFYQLNAGGKVVTKKMVLQ